MGNMLSDIKAIEPVNKRFGNKTFKGYDVGGGMFLYNLTDIPTPVFFANMGRTLECCGYVASIVINRRKSNENKGGCTLLSNTVTHKVINLPKPSPNAIFLVSREVYFFCQDRHDVFILSQNESDALRIGLHMGSLFIEGRGEIKFLSKE